MPTATKRKSRARWISCSLCDARFSLATPYPSTQGYGCASSLFSRAGQWYVQGFYGSRLHDMYRYRVVLRDGLHKIPRRQTESICDICVQGWLLTKQLILVDEHVL